MINAPNAMDWIPDCRCAFRRSSLGLVYGMTDCPRSFKLYGMTVLVRLNSRLLDACPRFLSLCDATEGAGDPDASQFGVKNPVVSVVIIRALANANINAYQCSRGRADFAESNVKPRRCGRKSNHES
jgi:hypothetical protein